MHAAQERAHHAELRGCAEAAGGMAQAEAEYKDFILFYPTMEEAAESQFKIGVTILPSTEPSALTGRLQPLHRNIPARVPRRY